MTHTSHRWLNRFAWLLAGATFLLIIAGANVTSHRAGLAVPDWPATYGEFMYSFPVSKWVGNILHEHGHRLIASTVGLLTVALALWIRLAVADEKLLRLGYCAVLAVIAQGVLGGITVKFFLPPPISIAHAALAQAFFCITIALALATSTRRPTLECGDLSPLSPAGSRSVDKTVHSKTIFQLSLATTIAVYAQLLLGATIRHAETAVLAHLIGAIVVTLCVAGLVALIFRRVQRPDFMLRITALAVLVAAQVGLGAATYFVRVPKNADVELSTLQIVLPTLHLAIGALILGTSFALTLRSFRLLPADTSTLPRFHAPTLAHAYLELTKPRIVSMVLVTTTIGFFLGGKGFHSASALFFTLLGTALASGGSAVLNNYLERDVDCKMERTKNRALPTGQITPANALGFGIVLVLAGVTLLAWQVNLLTAFLVLLAAFLYVVVYTPMKRLTWLNTAVGAIPGAIPPLSGWAAATGHLDLGAWVLFSILFAWQHPHFYAIAWMFKDDYRNAGFKMLPVVDPSGRRMFRQTAFFSLLLIALSVLPSVIGMTGRVYFVGALVLGAALFGVGAWMSFSKSFNAARRLLKASVLYLPLLCVLMMVDKL